MSGKIVSLSMLILISISGCSSPSVRISTSPPNARVTVRAVGSTQRDEAGETPLSIKASKLSRAHRGQGPLFVEISKPGYQVSNILVTDYSATDIDLHQDLQPIDGLADASIVNHSIDHLFEAQRLAKLNRLDESLKELGEVERIAPQLAATYELRGGIRYLKKQFREALEDYTRVVQLNPKNSEARRMQEALQALLKKGKGN